MATKRKLKLSREPKEGVRQGQDFVNPIKEKVFKILKARGGRRKGFC